MKTKILLLTTLFSMQMMLAQLKQVTYSDVNQKLNGYGILAKTPSENKPGILILPA